MGLPYLKLVGGLALLVIAAKLLVPNGEEQESVGSASHLWAAVQIVVIADIVMSLDNVIAVAAAANGSVPLLVFGLASSIPLIIAGAALIMALLGMLPILVWAGSALLGWIAGDVIATDPAIHPRLQSLFEGAIRHRARCAAAPSSAWRRCSSGGNGGEIACAVLGVIVVLVAGAIWRRQSPHFAAQGARRLAPDDRSGAADQPRQLLEAAADAIGDEIDHPVFEHQHQLAAVAAEMRRRQHARPRRRNQMGDTKCRAEHARALEHRRRHQLAG